LYITATCNGGNAAVKTSVVETATESEYTMPVDEMPAAVDMARIGYKIKLRMGMSKKTKNNYIFETLFFYTYQKA